MAESPSAPPAPVPTIEPEAALRPGRGDPIALLSVWYVRKASYSVIALGFLVGAVVERNGGLAVDTGSTEDLWEQLQSPLAGVILGVGMRLLASFVALLLAYPLARLRDEGLEPRLYRGSSLTGRLDRLHSARAYRSLRWTHHVRQVALRRLGSTGARLAVLDPIMDAANVTLMVLALGAAVLVGQNSV